MILSLTSVIALRTKGIEAIRTHLFDRKLVSFTHALYNRDSSLIMLDCWRRWKSWIRNKRRWRSAIWQYRLAWVDIRARAVLIAWRTTVRNIIDKRKANILDSTSSSHAQVNNYNHKNSDKNNDTDKVGRDFMDPFMARGIEI